MERELRNLAATIGPSRTAADVSPRLRTVRPIDRLSVPGSTMLTGTFAGQPIIVSHVSGWKRRRDARDFDGLHAGVSEPSRSAHAAYAGKEAYKTPCASATASVLVASGADGEASAAAASMPAAVSTRPAGASASLQPYAQVSPPLNVKAPSGAASIGAPPTAAKAHWWSSRRCGGSSGAKCDATSNADCKSRKVGEGAVGWQLDVYWPPDRRWFHAEVISHDLQRGSHEILYPVGSDGGAETELHVCLGSSRVHLISTTPTPLPWRFDCVCGVRFDNTHNANVDGSLCVQCYNCERWMHGGCVGSDGMVQTPAYALEAAKIDAVRRLTGPGARQQLCWLASERQFCCPACACPGELAPQTGIHAQPEKWVEDASDAEEATTLEKNAGKPLCIGELRPKLSSCMCVRPMCQFAQSRWGRAAGAPAVVCDQCYARMHVHCSLRHLRAFHQRCADAVAAGRRCDELQHLCPRCSGDSHLAAAATGATAAADGVSSSDEAEGEGIQDDDLPASGQQLVVRDGPPPSALSSRVRRVAPCGACFQCTHSDFYVTCARRADARYEAMPVLIPLAELRIGARGSLNPAIVKAILAPYGASPPSPPEKPANEHARAKVPSSLAPSLFRDEVLRGIVHRVVGAPYESAAGGHRHPVYVVVHFDNGAVVTLSEASFLRFARTPLVPLIYQSPAVRQLSKLDDAELEDPLSGSLRVLKELLRRSDCYHRLEVRETTKMKGGRMTTMNGVFARRLKSSRHRTAIRTGRFVGIYSGTVVRREQTLSAEHANQQYLFDLNEHVTIDGSRGGNVTRYINHANTLAEANLDPHKVEIDGEIMIAFIARRPINDGEELLYRYGDFSFLSGEWAEPASDVDNEDEANESGADDESSPASSAVPNGKAELLPAAGVGAAAGVAAAAAPIADAPAKAAPAPVPPTALVPLPSASEAPAAAPGPPPAEPASEESPPRFGVTRDPIATVAPYRACVQLEDACHWIGRFETLNEAARAFDSFVSKGKLPLPTNKSTMLEMRSGHERQAPSVPPRVRILSGDGSGSIGEVSPADHGYFAVRVRSNHVMLKRGDEIVLHRGDERRARAEDPNQAAPPASAIYQAANLGEPGLRAHVRALSLELASVRSQLEQSHLALSTTCDLLHALAHVEANATLERDRHLSDELAWCDEMASHASVATDSELAHLLAARRDDIKRAMCGTHTSASEVNTSLAAIRSALTGYFEAHAPIPHVLAPTTQRVMAAASTLAPAARPAALHTAVRPANRPLAATDVRPHRPTARSASVKAFRRSIIGRQVKVNIGYMEGEVGMIVGLNGRYLRVRFGSYVVNKIFENIELLPLDGSDS